MSTQELYPDKSQQIMTVERSKSRQSPEVSETNDSKESKETKPGSRKEPCIRKSKKDTSQSAMRNRNAQSSQIAQADSSRGSKMVNSE